MSGIGGKMPLPAPEENSENDRRLWIGNLDLRITEFVLLKLVQKFGKPERFDFIYHTSGPDKGKPRGYCFLAERAIAGLNGKMALSRRLIVHWANEKFQPEPQPPLVSKPAPEQTPAEQHSTQTTHDSTESKIHAIEAKLMSMQQTQKDFGLSELPAAPPGSSRYSSANAVQTKQNKPSSSRRRPYVPHNHRSRRR
ncbi:hypothetical protein BaRGS_00030869 [Batillaria attramentaria]|uniref:Probable RNA-binding protein 18 n=1 Tax=Batillaria attramentaria TaxID=370345 RepID=A0ABD0JSP2_9CAEN